MICSFPPQDEFPAADESVDEFPSVLKWRSKPAVASMSVSLPNLLGKSSSNLSAPDTPVHPEQILEGDKTLQTMTARCWGQSPRLQLKLHADILIQKKKQRKKKHHQFHLLLLRGRRERSRMKAALITPKPPSNLSSCQTKAAERPQICNLVPALHHR